MYRRTARLTVCQDDDRKTYFILYEMHDRDRLISSQRIPAKAIINTFTRISVLEHDGYTDEMDNVKTFRAEEDNPQL